MLKKITITLIWLGYGILCVLLFRLYIADFYYKKSQNLVLYKYKAKADEYIKTAIRYNPYEPNYLRGKARVDLLKLLGDQNKKQVKTQVLTDAIDAYKFNPDNLVTIRNLFPIYYFLAVRDLNNPSSKDNIDKDFVNISKKYFEDNKHRYWNDAGVIADVASYEKKLGFSYEYQESKERIKKLRPDLLLWNDSFR